MKTIATILSILVMITGMYELFYIKNLAGVFFMALGSMCYFLLTAKEEKIPGTLS